MINIDFGRKWFKPALGAVFCSAMLCLSGCSALTGGGMDNPTEPGPPPKPVIHIGDTVHVEFSESSLRPVDETVREDGMIGILNVGRIQAVGKTAQELQDDIKNKLVPDYYVRLLVTVSVPYFYYVGGEVNGRGGRFPYSESITVIKAIQSAGDFNDFANKKAVIITRADGRVLTENVLDARKNPKKDLSVYPGDRIHVEKRIW